MKCFSARGLARGYERGRAHIRALNRAHALGQSTVIPPIPQLPEPPKSAVPTQPTDRHQPLNDADTLPLANH